MFEFLQVDGKQDLRNIGVADSDIPAVISYFRIKMLLMLMSGFALGLAMCMWFAGMIVIAR